MAGLPVPVHGVRVAFQYICCGPFARLTADFEPPGDGDEPDIVNTVPDELLPAEYLPAIRAGLLEGLDGVAARVRITDGRHHEVDSSEYGFKMAGRMAGRAALVGAGLLPPEEAEQLPKVTWPGKPALTEDRGRRPGT
ncbi:hypothetical protein ABZ729_18810 [Streptomyces sp. NPDC006678]|uniref:hypothetical protein n=1 Tax=unclassified Streptomyces TaxID=2593676 RepID=UPI0033EEF8EB